VAVGPSFAVLGVLALAPVSTSVGQDERDDLLEERTTLLQVAQAFSGDCRYGLEYTSWTVPLEALLPFTEGLCSDRPESVPDRAALRELLDSAPARKPGRVGERADPITEPVLHGATSLRVVASAERILQFSPDDPLFPRILRTPGLEVNLMSGSKLYFSTSTQNTLFDLAELVTPLPVTTGRQEGFRKLQWGRGEGPAGVTLWASGRGGYPRWQFQCAAAGSLPVAAWHALAEGGLPSLLTLLEYEEVEGGQIRLASVLRCASSGEVWRVSEFVLRGFELGAKEEDFLLPVGRAQDIRLIQDRRDPSRPVEMRLEEIPEPWLRLLDLEG